MRISPLAKNLIGGSILLGLAGLILYPAMMSAKVGAHRSSCQSNLKQIARACAFYTRDYDGVLPPLSNGKSGWAELIETEPKMWPAFQCPSTNPRDKEFSTDYFLNARVAGLKRSHISFGATTILFGEGVDNGATNSHFSELPLNWKTDADSPAKRHLDGANYAFVDGHVKWLKPEKITGDAPKNGNATFAVR